MSKIKSTGKIEGPAGCLLAILVFAMIGFGFVGWSTASLIMVVVRALT